MTHHNLRRRLPRHSGLLAFFTVLLGLSLTALPVSAAAPPHPTYGSATVDGQIDEWDLTHDFFGPMYRAGFETKTNESNLYLRYDCQTKTMHVLVYQANDQIPVLKEPQNAWIAIDSISNKVVNGNSGNEGTPPDFQWIEEGYDGDQDHARGWEAAFSLSEGTYQILAHTNVYDDGASQTSATVRGGLDLTVTCASIGDLVWFDINANGIQDNGEPGIEDAVVTLEDTNGLLESTVTNADGLYLFPDLNAGTYTVTTQSVPRPNYIHISGPNPHPVTLDPGEIYTDADFGYGSLNVSLEPNNTGVAEPCTTITYTHTITNLGTLTETFELTAISSEGFGPTLYVNGTQATHVPDLGVFETAEISVTLEVPCEATPGIMDTTTITATASRDPNLFDVARDYTTIPEDLTPGISVTPTLEIDIPERPYSTTLYFAQNWTNTGDVQDRFNLTLSGIPEGWEVRAHREETAATPNPTGVYSGTGSLDTTNWITVAAYIAGSVNVNADADDGDGIPDSGPLDPSETTQVILEVTVPPNTPAASYTITERATADGNPAVYDEEFKTVDVTPTGSIGDYVWYDLNGDGIQDPNEPGLPGVELSLTGADGSERTTTTDSGGNYDFVQLPRGRYTVTVNSSTLPVGFVLTGGTDPHVVCLCAGDDYTGADYNQADFGYQGSGSIGDLVWNDRDGDGIQDPGEPGIEGVVLTLTLESGHVTTTTTDGEGLYLFSGLFDGTYDVALDTGTLPVGVLQTYDLDGTLDHSTRIPLGEQEDRRDADFGYQGHAALGDYVWIDSDGSGSQDAGEPPLSGVTVWLLDELDNPILDVNGDPITDVTDSSGLYLFDHLLPGTYVVQFAPPAGYIFTAAGAGSDEALDSDADPSSGKTGLITLSVEELDNTVDAGLRVGLGGTVWHDVDGNSALSRTIESGISGVVVELYQMVEGTIGLTPIMTTTTDVNGDYAFTGVTGPFTYSVGIRDIEIPSSYGYSSDGGAHDPTTTDDDEAGMGDDGVPLYDYVLTQPFPFDGTDPTDTVDFGFRAEPTAAKLSGFNPLRRGLSSGRSIWVSIGAVASAIAIIIGFRRHGKRRRP